MIVLFTDFGLEGPYVGQMKAVLYQGAPGVPVVDLFADLPPFDPEGAAYLLAAYAEAFPAGTVFLCVVDPGVGGERRAVAVRADGRWFVGPDNGLCNMVARRAAALEWWELDPAPAQASATFHGRDLFAPVAARVVRGERVPGRRVEAGARVRADWPEHLERIVYIDHYGNAMSGVLARAVDETSVVEVHGHRLRRARTFAEVRLGEGMWYENANGLVEIAVNQGRADRDLGLHVGTPITLSRP